MSASIRGPQGSYYRTCLTVLGNPVIGKVDVSRRHIYRHVPAAEHEAAVFVGGIDRDVLPDIR